jgi:hypothetical protein
MEDNMIINKKLCLSGVLTYMRENDKPLHFTQTLYEIDNFLKTNTEYSDVNVLVEVLERLVFLSTFIEPQGSCLLDILKGIFSRFSRHITRFEISSLENLLKIMQLYRSLLIRGLKPYEEVNVLLDQFISDLNFAVEYDSKIRDERVLYYLQFYNDKNLVNEHSLSLSLSDIAKNSIILSNSSVMESSHIDRSEERKQDVSTSVSTMIRTEDVSSKRDSKELNETKYLSSMEMEKIELPSEIEHLKNLSMCEKFINKKYEVIMADESHERLLDKVSMEKLTLVFNHKVTGYNDLTPLFSKFISKHLTFVIGSYRYNYLFDGLNKQSTTIDFLIMKKPGSEGVADQNNAKSLSKYITRFNQNGQYQLTDFKKEASNQYVGKFTDNTKNNSSRLRFIFYKPEYEKSCDIIKEINSPTLIKTHRFLQDILFKTLGWLFKTRYHITLLIIAYMEYRFNVFKFEKTKLDKCYYLPISSAYNNNIAHEELSRVLLDVFRYVLNFLVYLNFKVIGINYPPGVGGVAEMFERHGGYLLDSEYLLNLNLFVVELRNRGNKVMVEFNRTLALLQEFYLYILEIAAKEIEDYAMLMEVYMSKFN